LNNNWNKNWNNNYWKPKINTQIIQNNNFQESFNEALKIFLNECISICLPELDNIDTNINYMYTYSKIIKIDISDNIIEINKINFLKNKFMESKIFKQKLIDELILCVSAANISIFPDYNNKNKYCIKFQKK
jgi:hypothetical protein